MMISDYYPSGLTKYILPFIPLCHLVYICHNPHVWLNILSLCVAKLYDHKASTNITYIFYKLDTILYIKRHQRMYKICNIVGYFKSR